MIQSGRFLGNVQGNLGKKVITNLAILLAKDSLFGLESNLTSKVINQF